ncbi:MAG: hypothetical protein WB697_20945 [Stellaceae bacterium]
MRYALALAPFLLAALAMVSAYAEPDNAMPVKVSEKIIGELAKADLDAVSADAAKYMGTNAGNDIKNSFASIKNLGQSQYTDLVYTRDYGQTTKDMIYKIDFDKAFAFVRFLWEIDNGNWHLVHLQYKTDNDLPFPAGWEHIYPK